MEKSKRRRKKCICCKRLFIPDPRSAYHQRYCPKTRCRKASHAASQKRWHSKPTNLKYWCGPDEVARVRTWREEHPGYWRRWKRKERVRYKTT